MQFLGNKEAKGEMGMTLQLLNANNLRTAIVVQRASMRDFALTLLPDGTLEATDGQHIAALFPETFAPIGKTVFLYPRKTIPKSQKRPVWQDFAEIIDQPRTQPRVAEVVKHAATAQASLQPVACFGMQLQKVLSTLPNNAQYTLQARQDAEKMFLVLYHKRAAIVFSGGEVC